MWKVLHVFQAKGDSLVHIKRVTELKKILNQATWEKARDICCSIGTTLASVETQGKHDCIATAVEGD
jgi:hypothetical protein